MADPTPTPPEPTTDADTPAPPAEIPTLWHDDKPLELPGETATPRRTVFVWLLGFLIACGVLISVMIWLRPAPKPYFAPFFVSDYQYRPFHTPPFSKQDQAGLTGGNYFGAGHIQLKAVGATTPADTLVAYLSGYAICDDQGRVLFVPVDADPSTPQAFRSLRNVLTILKDSPAQKKLLVLDICWPLEDPYWGRLDVGVAARIPEELAQVEDKTRLVLVPCAPGQIPLASPELGRSVFGFFVEEALRGWSDVPQHAAPRDGPGEPIPERQGIVSVHRLGNYVQTKVSEWAKLHHNASQTPVLYGNLPDFPLLALAKGKALAHLERPTVEPYPAWLIDAWKTRGRWHSQERHRTAPWLYRQAEAAIDHADRCWQYGGDTDALKKQMNAELERVEKYYQRIAKTTRPETLSLARHFASPPLGEGTLDPKWTAGVKELFKKIVEVRATAAKVDEGEKAAAKLVEEFVEKNKQVSDADWAGAIVEVLAAEPFPRRDTVRLAERLLASRQAATKFVEADMVQRLARLADTFDDATWPVALVRKSLELTRKAEQAAVRPRSFAWFASALESAAQKRHDAELSLFARGYVSLSAVEAPLTEALREFETLTAKQDLLEDALREMHDALATLPGYSAYLDHVLTLEPVWHDAARTTLTLQKLLVAKAGITASELNALLEDAGNQTQSLKASMRELKQAHAPETLDELFTRANRPDADVKVYREVLAQWSVPFHAPELRAKLWETRGKLGEKLAAKILDAEAAEPIDEPDAALDLQNARTIAAARSARSIALLRLAGLEAAALARLEEQHAAFVSFQAGDEKAAAAVRDGHALAFAIRQAWAMTLPRQTAAETDPLIYERVSRIAPGWVRLGAKEELLAKAGMSIHQEAERAVWAWQADRARYASQEPDPSPLTMRAAFTLRDYAPKQAAGFTLPATPTVAELTTMKPSQILKIPLTWRALPKDPPAVTFQLVGASEDWLQITADAVGPTDLSLQVALKPQAELSASPRPAGFLFSLTFAGRTMHHKVNLPSLPSGDRLDIIVSASPKEVGVPFGDLRLRPSKDRQAYYVYVNNLSEKPRSLIVELRANDKVFAGGAVAFIAPPKQATRVSFGTGKPLSSAPVLPPGEKGDKPKDELPELTGSLQIRVFDKDRPLDALVTRELRVDLAEPREYVRVPTIRFEPPSDANMKKNRLDVTVQAVRKLEAPPCLVELIVPIDRIPGLRAVRTGTFRGELPLDGAPLKLSAGEFEFDPFANDTGIVSLTVDGIERAFLFRTTFAPVGEPTTPREELRPVMWLSAGRYYRTNTKFEATVEIDNAPAAAQLLVSLGHLRPGQIGDAFEAEIRHPSLPPRQKRIGVGLRADGGVEFDTLLRDWRVPFAAVPVRGERVVQARLVDAEGKDIVPPAYSRVFFDDRVPERVAFVNLPKQAKRDVGYRLKATGVDQGSGIKEVAFYMGKPTDDGKPPAGAPKFDARPAPGEPDVWQAIVEWPMARKGFVDVSVQFTNKLGLSAFARGEVELVEFEPEKTAPGTIDGVVVEGDRPQTGIVVALFDAKGNKLAEQKTKEGGTFAFVGVPPGQYVVRATKPTSGTPLTATSKVNLAPGKSERLKLALFL